MGCKAMQTAHNIKHTFDPGTAKEHTVRWWFEKFCKGDKSLEEVEHSGRPLEADPLTSTQEVAQELSADHLMVLQHLRQIGNVKKLGKLGVL